MKYLVFIFSLIFVLTGCDLFFAEDDSELRSLRFSRGERFIEPYEAYDAGLPLVISAGTTEQTFNKPVFIPVYSSSGQFTKVYLRTLHAISAADLAEIINDEEGSAIITVKEADREHAFDRETNRYTTSPGTVEKIRNWINNMQGVEVVDQIINSPVLVLQMDATPEIIDTIRKSKNVQVLEPNSKIWLLGTGAKSNTKTQASASLPNQQSQNSIIDYPISVKAVIYTTTDKSSGGFYVQPGDTITARYSHPDGREFTATTTIK